jgi:hypothetical protein
MKSSTLINYGASGMKLMNSNFEVGIKYKVPPSPPHPRAQPSPAQSNPGTCASSGSEHTIIIRHDTTLQRISLWAITDSARRAGRRRDVLRAPRLRPHGALQQGQARCAPAPSRPRPIGAMLCQAPCRHSLPQRHPAEPRDRRFTLHPIGVAHASRAPVPGAPAHGLRRRARRSAGQGLPHPHGQGTLRGHGRRQVSRSHHPG